MPLLHDLSVGVLEAIDLVGPGPAALDELAVLGLLEVERGERVGLVVRGDVEDTLPV